MTQVVEDKAVLTVRRLLGSQSETGSANLQSIGVLNLARMYNGISS